MVSKFPSDSEHTAFFSVPERPQMEIPMATCIPPCTEAPSFYTYELVYTFLTRK